MSKKREYRIQSKDINFVEGRYILFTIQFSPKILSIRQHYRTENKWITYNTILNTWVNLFSQLC